MLLDQNLAKADEILDDADEKLRKLLITMPQSGDLETEITMAEQWKQAIQLVRNLLAVDKDSTSDTHELDELRTQVAKLLKETQSLTQEKQELEVKNEELRAENDALISKNQELGSVNTQLINEEQNLREQNAELERQGRELTEAKRRLEAENSTLTTDIEALRQQLLALQENDKTSELSQAKAQLLVQLQAMTVEKEEILMQNTTLSDRIHKLEVENRELLARLENNNVTQGSNVGEDSQRNFQELQVDISAKPEETTLEVASEAASETTSQTTSETVPDEQTIEQEQVAVPNLGEIKQHNYWWLLFPIIGLLVGLVLWLKRVLMGKRD